MVLRIPSPSAVLEVRKEPHHACSFYLRVEVLPFYEHGFLVGAVQEAMLEHICPGCLAVCQEGFTILDAAATEFYCTISPARRTKLTLIVEAHPLLESRHERVPLLHPKCSISRLGQKKLLKADISAQVVCEEVHNLGECRATANGSCQLEPLHPVRNLRLVEVSV